MTQASSRSCRRRFLAKFYLKLEALTPKRRLEFYAKNGVFENALGVVSCDLDVHAQCHVCFVWTSYKLRSIITRIPIVNICGFVTYPSQILVFFGQVKFLQSPITTCISIYLGDYRHETLRISNINTFPTSSTHLSR